MSIALLLGAYYAAKEEEEESKSASLADRDPACPSLGRQKLTLIGRARGRAGDRLDWGKVLAAQGGGGHPAAASASLTTEDPLGTVQEVMAVVRIAPTSPAHRPRSDVVAGAHHSPRHHNP
jgi:hypothetical protein